MGRLSRGIQPARESLAWYLDIPQWRCSRGCWIDVTERRCYAHGEIGPCCDDCGGDGFFDEPGSEREYRCNSCEGHGMQWDWPDDGARALSGASE